MSSSHSLNWPVPPSATSPSTEGDKTRVSTPDSGGGGYFTLSESEAGSNDELRYNKDFNGSPRKFCRKIFGGFRSRSQTPPRPRNIKERTLRQDRALQNWDTNLKLQRE